MGLNLMHQPAHNPYVRRAFFTLLAALLLCLAALTAALAEPATFGPWQRLSDPFPGAANLRLTDMAVAPDGSLYVGAYPGGVARSTDGGASWSLINTGLPDLHVSALGVNKLSEPVAAVGVNPCVGAFRYRNGRWFAASGISASLRISAFTLDQTGALIAVTGWAGDVFRSNDDGSSFYKAASSIGQGGGALWAVALGPDGSLYAGGEMPGGLYLSRDNGNNWRQFALSNEQGYKGNLFAICFNKQGELLVGRTQAVTGSDIQRYSGGQWQPSSKGIPDWRNVLSFALASDGTLYCTASLHGSAGVYRSTDGGHTWQDYAFGIPSPAYRRIAVNKDTVYLISQDSIYKAGVSAAP
ncbi:MAG TPA: hypothetical protein VFW40_01835 [Capsulimonadaceae bacterium]|nr:hypothetical protein [Capsulimonadaceae bacterium]